MPNLFTLVLTIVVLTLNILVILYLNDLEKKGCKCAMDFRRVYILGFTIAMVVLGGINLFFGPAYRRFLLSLGAVFGGLYGLAVLGAGITNVVFVFQYIADLKAKKCECSESVYRDIMYGLAIFSSISYGFLLFMIVAILGLVGTVGFSGAMKKGLKDTMKEMNR